MQVWTHELDAHLAQTEDRVQLEKTEQQILLEYNEIKSEIEDNELRYNLTFTRPFSSYLIPKDPAHLARERRLYFERLAHVRTIPDVLLLSDEFQHELDTCAPLSSDYTPESLPLLLQEFYLKRLSLLTYAKTLHGVRWKRFCRQQINFAYVEQQFNERSSRILAEFNDALQRSQRLSSVRESLMGPPVTSAKNVNQPLANDDYVAYVRYLVCHYRGQKYFDQLSEHVRISHFKFRTLHSSDTQTLVINLEPQTSPFEKTAALHHLPTVELDQKQTLEKLDVLFRLYSLPFDTSKIRTSGDEMELYANIIRHYRTIFSEQEKRRPTILYDSAKPKTISQARQSSGCQLIKQSSWINFVTLKPELDPKRERDYWKYIKGGKNDELLTRIVDFFNVKNADKAANILKQYLLAVKVKRSNALKQVLETSTTNNAQATSMTDIFWKNIFEVSSADGTNRENDKEDDNDNDELPDSFDFRDTSTRSHRYMKRDEFNYLETLQKLGLDDMAGHDRDSDTENNDASESYGLQLSYITLRLLRIRTLRDRCLHEFNYLRSIQRTLTIYEQRLITTSKGKEFQPVDQRFTNQVPHTYLFDMPHQCTLDTLNFMQSGEHVENVEDYAREVVIDNDGAIVHLQDSAGLHIVYDVAFDDVNELEQEMISICSYFIEKVSLKQSKNSDFSRKIDRFEMLYNLWEYELTYLQYKRKLIDCFYEVYQHTLDQNERHLIAQTIANITARRPRIDFRNDDYFAHSYSLEIRILSQYLSLVREYIGRHLTDMRQITENIIESSDYGSFFSAARSQSSPPVYLSVSKIHSYYLFEFLESLSSLSRLPLLLKQSCNELVEFEQLQHQRNLTLIEELLYETEYFDELCSTYKQLEQPGGTFTVNQQRDFFNTFFSDHPTMMGNLAYDILKQIDETRTTKKEQYEKFIKLSTNLIQLISLRYRLIRSATESELLTKVYKQQLDTMSIDHSHLYLRYVQFEFAQPKNVSPTDEYDGGSSSVADGRLDKIGSQPNTTFAMQELDEASIGRISFRQKDQWLTLMNDADDVISNLKTSLRLQFMHNHLVYTAILQHRVAIVCITQQLQIAKPEGKAEETKGSLVGKRQVAGTNKQTDQPSALLSNVLYENARRKLFREQYFISIQFEKMPCRDRVLNEFLRQRESKPLQYQQPREVEKLKRSLLNEFIDRVQRRNTLIMLRLQILQSYLSLTYLINQFPLTSRTHFMWSKPVPPPLPTTIVTSSMTDQTESNVSTPAPVSTSTVNGFKSRPKMIVNENGTDLANIWYIPSFNELLTMFKNSKLKITELERRLCDLLRIVSSLNDLIHIVVGYAQLSNATSNAEQRFNERAYELTAFDQSGELASELHEIQREIDSASSLSLSTVADLLETKRRLTIFEIYYSLSCLVPNCFLIGKNQSTFNLVYSRSKPILKQFIFDYEHLRPTHTILPNPLISVQPLSKHLYPWAVHEHRYNVNSRRLWWAKFSLLDLIHVCLAGLKSSDLTLANAELVTTHIMLQNIDSVIKPKAVKNGLATILRHKEIVADDHLSKYLGLEIHLVECIRLEIIRNAWSITKFNGVLPDTVKTFDDAYSSFRDEVRSPVLRQLATSVGYNSYYNDFPIALHTGQLPPHVTEYECKQALIMRLLIELEGKFMMNDTLKRFKRERTLIMSERLREENSLPTDLWKSQQFTETFSVIRPHILDEFAGLLTHYECKDEQSILNRTVIAEETLGDAETTTALSTTLDSTSVPEFFCIRRSDLELCLKEMGSRIMQRERDNYTNYSFYYESLLHNARQLVALRETEIKALRSQIQDQQFTIELESHIMTLQAYFDLINELMHLRLTNAQLQNERQLRFDKQLCQIRDRFQSITEQLLNTNLLLRTRFEQYSEQLYHSTVTVVKEMREEIYKIARAKLASDAKSIIDQQHREQTKLIQSLQEELHQNQEKKITEAHQREHEWRKEQIQLEKTIGELQYDFDRYQKRYVYRTTQQVEEIQTLKKANNYLRKRIISNENQYKKAFETEHRSESKANLERDDDLRQALNQKNIIETRLRWMQEQSNQLRLRDHELEKKTSEFERENRAMRVAQTYVKRDLIQTKKKLEQERSLKIDAFQQVETLRTNLTEIEEELEQIVLTDGANSVLSATIAPPPSRAIGSSRPITPYHTLMARNRPMTSSAPYQREKQRFSTSRLRCYSTTPTKRVQTASVHIEKITPLTEELLSNLGVSTPPATSSIKMLRIKSAKT